MDSTDYLVWGIALHLIADWVFQNDWIASNKGSLRHPAAWVHGAIHALAMLLVFPWWAALIIGISHTLIDTRVPARLWQQFYGQTTDGPFALPVAIWLDQVCHITILALFAWLLAGAR